MIRVYHIYITQICRSRFIRKVYRVGKRNIPNWEGFKLGIARFHPMFMLMVKLGEADCHLTASRPRCGNYYKGMFCFYIIIFTIAFITYNSRYIIWITRYRIMPVYLNSKCFKFLLVPYGTFLSLKLCKNHTSDKKSVASKCIYESKYIHIISYSKVSAHLILLDIGRIDYHYYLYIVPYLGKHPYLTVRLKARKHS